jgi:hypothetical protein
MTWKTISEFPDYEINRRGDVRRRTRSGHWDIGRPLKQHRSDTGHLYVVFGRKDRTFKRYISRLLLTTFVKPPPFVGAMALHKDDIPNNNKLKNLYWGNRKNNYDDRMRNRGWDRKRYAAKGSALPNAKLKERQIPRIRRMLNDGYRRREVAEKFSVSQSTISDIALGYSWAHVK